MKFRLEGGTHYADVDGVEVEFKRGSVIETDQDLRAMHGDKFVLLVDSAPPPPKLKYIDLGSMSDEELGALADSLELKLDGDRQDYIAAIKAAL